MKAKEVKKILGITQYTLYRYLKEGKVKLSCTAFYKQNKLY